MSLLALICLQGYGLMMMEQQKVSSKGYLFTRGPGNYKIPGFGDIPVEFNVSLLKGSVNKKAVYSSKVSYGYSSCIHTYAIVLVQSTVICRYIPFTFVPGNNNNIS